MNSGRQRNEFLDPPRISPAFENFYEFLMFVDFFETNSIMPNLTRSDRNVPAMAVGKGLIGIFGSATSRPGENFDAGHHL